MEFIFRTLSQIYSPGTISEIDIMSIQLPSTTNAALACLEKYQLVDKQSISLDCGEWDKCSSLRSGVYSVRYSGILFYFYLKIGSTKKMYISLTGGAGGPKRDHGPFFSRWTYAEPDKFTLLCIDDPMVPMYKVHHGWFYGTESVDFTKLASDLVKDIATNLNIAYSNLIFFSSSSGGTASICCAYYIKNACTVVAVNPQINLNQDSFTPYVSRRLGFDILKDTNRSDIINKIISCTEVNVVLLENIASKEDYEDNFIELCKRANICPMYGLTKHGHIITWLYNAIDEFPHNAQDWKEFFPFIDYLVDLIRLNKNLSGSEQINDLMYSFYSQKNRLVYSFLKEVLCSEDDEYFVNLCMHYAQHSAQYSELLGVYYANEKHLDLDLAIQYLKRNLHNINIKKKYIELCLRRGLDNDFLEIEKILDDPAIGKNYAILSEIYHKCININKCRVAEHVLCLMSNADVPKDKLISLVDLLRKTNNRSCWECAYQICVKYSDMPGGFMQLRRGYLLREGKGCNPNLDEAISCMRVAASMGHRWANVDLVNVLIYTDFPKYWKEAYSLCIEHISEFEGVFQSKLATMYLEGKYVKLDIEKSVGLLRDLINKGYTKYELQLAESLSQLNDNPQALFEAYKIYESHLNTDEKFVKSRIAKLLLESKSDKRFEAAYYSRGTTAVIKNQVRILGVISKSLNKYHKCVIID